MEIGLISEIYRAGNWQLTAGLTLALGLYPSSGFISVSHDAIFSTSSAHDLRWQHTDLKPCKYFKRIQEDRQKAVSNCISVLTLQSHCKQTDKPLQKWSSEVSLPPRSLAACCTASGKYRMALPGTAGQVSSATAWVLPLNPAGKIIWQKKEKKLRRKKKI